MATTEPQYQNYVLASVIPAEADLKSEYDATFSITVTPRSGATPSGGNLYFKLTSAYAGSSEVSFGGTVATDEKDEFIARPSDMPYVAGTHGDGISAVNTVAKLTSNGATLSVVVTGDGSKSSMIAFMKAISVEYAWVNEAV